MKVLLLVLIFVLIWKYTGAASVSRFDQNCSNDASTSDPPCVHSTTENFLNSTSEYGTEETITVAIHEANDTNMGSLDNDVSFPLLSSSNTTDGTMGDRIKRDVTTKMVHHHHRQAKLSSTQEPPERNETTARTLFEELQEAENDIRKAENSSFTKKLIRKKRIDDTNYSNDQPTGRRLLAVVSGLNESEDEAPSEFSGNGIMQVTPKYVPKDQLQVTFYVRCVCVVQFHEATATKKETVITEYVLDYQEKISFHDKANLCSTTCCSKSKDLLPHNHDIMLCMFAQNYQELIKLEELVQDDDGNSNTIICKAFLRDTNLCYEDLVLLARQLVMNVTVGLLALLILCMLTISFILYKQRAYYISTFRSH